MRILQALHHMVGSRSAVVAGRERAWLTRLLPQAGTSMIGPRRRGLCIRSLDRQPLLEPMMQVLHVAARRDRSRLSDPGAADLLHVTVPQVYDVVGDDADEDAVVEALRQANYNVAEAIDALLSRGGGERCALCLKHPRNSA